MIDLKRRAFIFGATATLWKPKRTFYFLPKISDGEFVYRKPITAIQWQYDDTLLGPADDEVIRYVINSRFLSADEWLKLADIDPTPFNDMSPLNRVIE